MKNSDELLSELNELRVFVFQEQEDGKFRQVGLDSEQYKKVTEALCVSLKPDASLKRGYEMATVRFNPDWEIDADTFLGLETTYDFSDEEDDTEA